MVYHLFPITFFADLKFCHIFAIAFELSKTGPIAQLVRASDS